MGRLVALMMIFDRAYYDKVYNYLADNDAFAEIEALNKFYEMFVNLQDDNRDLQDENRRLHDELALMHVIATGSYERRGTTEE